MHPRARAGGGGGGTAKKSRAKRKSKEKIVPMGEPIFEEADEGGAADEPVAIDSPLTARRKKKEKEKQALELDDADRSRIEQESEEASVRHPALLLGPHASVSVLKTVLQNVVSSESNAEQKW